MWDRVAVAKSDSETSLFFDLMLLGEMLTKIAVVGLASLIEEDRQRHGYSIRFSLVRADSIGEWVQKLDELTSGPPRL
jgi:hypothetical protein